MHKHRMIISISGVILFLLAGAVTMFINPSEKSSQTSQTSQTSQNSPPARQMQTQSSQPNTPPKWYVHVSGAVAKPGVYEVPRDARVFHVIDAAGGLTDNADGIALNLAGVLADGVHVHVPAKGEGVSVAEASESPHETVRVSGVRESVPGSGFGRININRADINELQAVKGVGPAIAGRIVEYRNTHGAFRSVEDLINVRGIGASKMKQIRSQVTVQGGSSYVSGSSSGLVDINHAGLEELQRINGVGRTTAQRIIDYRNAHGQFSSIEDLINVKGIGTATLNKIRPQVVIR